MGSSTKVPKLTVRKSKNFWASLKITCMKITTWEFWPKDSWVKSSVIKCIKKNCAKNCYESLINWIRASRIVVEWLYTNCTKLPQMKIWYLKFVNVSAENAKIPSQAKPIFHFDHINYHSLLTFITHSYWFLSVVIWHYEFFLYNEFLLREIYYKIDAWRKKTHKDYTLIKTICWFPSNELQCTFLILIEAAAIEKGRAITCSDWLCNVKGFDSVANTKVTISLS